MDMQIWIEMDRFGLKWIDMDEWIDFDRIWIEMDNGQKAASVWYKMAFFKRVWHRIKVLPHP